MQEGMANPYDTIDAETMEYASVLVGYSADVGDGDLVMVTYDRPAEDLALAVQKQVLDAGGIPVTEETNTRFARGMFYAADDYQITAVPEYEQQRAEEVDARISIRAQENEAEMSDVPAEKRQARQKARQPLKEEIIGNTRWVGTKYPTPGFAQKANMSTDALRSFMFDACIRDWEDESANYDELKQIVDDGEHVQITGEKTDLEFSIGERNGVNRVGAKSDGTNNVPGGEVFTAPVADSVNGHVFFELPAFVQGETVSGVYLEFDDGAVVDYSAESGAAVLEEIIETDDGSRRLGELGIGTNFAITEPMKDTLYDEKIGGTVHLALGSAYRKNLAPAISPDDIDHDLAADRFAELAEQAEQYLTAGDTDAYGGFVNSLPNAERSAVAAYRDAWDAAQDEIGRQQNESAQHQDFVKEMREPASNGQDSELRIDGEVILRNGSFVGIDALQ